MSDIKTIKHQTKNFVWFMFFIHVTIFQGIAQTYFFDNYGIKQGLSTQKVYTLFQDSNNFIWLGTENGVSRFDGKKFENFTSRDSLAPGGVKCILEDSFGYIWFGHLNGGISRYNGLEFERAAFDSLKITGDITSICRIKNKLWFTSRFNGAILTELPVNNIKKIKSKQFMGREGLSDQVYGSNVNLDGALICVTDVGLKRFNKDENRFEGYRMPKMTTYFTTTCLLEDRNGNLWFGTYNGGLYKYLMSESRMVFYDLIKEHVSSNFVSCLAEDNQGRVWVGTGGGGIAVFEDDKIRKFDNTNGLKASKIFDIMMDAEGNILIADQDNGLTIYKGDAFVTLSDKELLPDQNVNAIIEDKTGAVWFGTNSDIIRYYPGSDNKHVTYSKINNLIYNNIRFFREDINDNIWIGTNGGGVIKYNMKSNKFESQPYINSNFPKDPRTVTAMEIDRKNNLWIGTLEDGVIFGTIGEQNFLRKNLLDSLIIDKITALYCDPNGVVWIGTEPRGEKPGLFKYDFSNRDFKKIKASAGIIPRAMTMDKNGVLWIGTNEGLYASRNDSVFSDATLDDGLLSNNINLLATGIDGSIFIGTNKGLNRYFPETRRIFSYTERNGFPGIETKPNAVYETPGGNLWFGTANGATELMTEKLLTEELEPLTRIIEMQVNNDICEMIPGMKLKYTERSIIFDYYSICLTNPDVVRYKVKLEGADQEWQPVTDQTRATYPALSPGKYKFMVVARNSQGIWNREPVTFSFIIKPPYYQTWWFIISMTAIIVVLVVIYIKRREQNLVNEKIVLEEKVEERTAEVVMKSMEIEEKNRDITASIRYAERIQRAMLPRENTFDETFVLFMPKDIVSGDFYWMYDNGDIQFIAVCDCTGHGVPGAFMSIIGHNSLNKIVREYGITRPSAILDQLNNEVLKALRQRNEETINDGMDMALIAFDKRKFSLDFAGAYNPLYIVRKGEVFIYRGDRFPIGMTAIGDKKNFSNQNIDIRPGDMIYMCSDGYADQFGASDGKKFRTGKVKKLLSEICDLPICEQKTRLQQEILDWKGNTEQVDDILFIGSRIREN
jgi:ligand-binding sensor domain-containing protein/serine phosphatase RsbU (regulator of sigma subunit)